LICDNKNIAIELLEEAGFLLAQQAFAKYNESDTAQNYILILSIF